MAADHHPVNRLALIRGLSRISCTFRTSRQWRSFHSKLTRHNDWLLSPPIGPPSSRHISTRLAARRGRRDLRKIQTADDLKCRRLTLAKTGHSVGNQGANATIATRLESGDIHDTLFPHYLMCLHRPCRRAGSYDAGGRPSACWCRLDPDARLHYRAEPSVRF